MNLRAKENVTHFWSSKLQKLSNLYGACIQPDERCPHRYWQAGSPQAGILVQGMGIPPLDVAQTPGVIAIIACPRLVQEMLAKHT